MPFQSQPMKPDSDRRSFSYGVSRRAIVSKFVVVAAFAFSWQIILAAESVSEPAWRALPLITDGKVDPNWVHVGWGAFVVDDGTLRTEPAPKGLGLLVYKKERLGNWHPRGHADGHEQLGLPL